MTNNEVKNLIGDRGAIFSPCKKYRYLLWQDFMNNPFRVVVFLMLNPSTADEMKNDPTVERCERFAKKWGFGGYEIINLFAWRDTDPSLMKGAWQPIGPENDYYIKKSCQGATMVICAWGNHGCHCDRSKNVLKILKDSGIVLHALKMNGTGEPAHPLYLPYKQEPFLI